MVASHISLGERKKVCLSFGENLKFNRSSTAREMQRDCVIRC